MNEEKFDAIKHIRDMLYLDQISNVLGFVPEGNNIIEKINAGVIILSENQVKEKAFDDQFCLELNLENPFTYNLNDENYYGFCCVH